MAGLFDRIDGATIDDNVNVHHAVAAFKGYALGLFTRVQVRDGINALLATPLSIAEEQDFDDIADQFDAQSNNTARLVYGGIVEALFVIAEAGLLTDAFWRSGLGI